MEGSLDNSTWFALADDLLVTANGTYGLFAAGRLARYVRGNFASETGGTDAQVTFQYRGCV